ncbi:MAG: EF-hand domain-containing protein [Planctomycetota bacterium]
MMTRIQSKCILASSLLAIQGVIATAVAIVHAQPPRERGGQPAVTVESSVNRLMTYDADGDGKLSRAEVTDSRLLALLQRCDANNDGIVTRDELMAQISKEAVMPARPGNGTTQTGPRPGGEANGPPGPGQIVPPFVIDELKLTDTQRSQLQELQKDVDAKLAKILTPEQLEQLRQSGNRRSGPPGGPDGRPPRPQ